jgi:tetratricopeptide (TPR) repeat protein
LAEHPDLSAEDYARKLTDAKQRLELVDASLGLSYDLLSEERRKLWRALAVFPGEFDAPAAAAVWGVTVLSADAAAADQDVAQPPSAVNGRDESRPYSVAASSPLSEVTPALRRIATDRAREALSALVGASMVEWNETSHRYRLHDLARDCADSRLTDDERAEYRRRHAEHYRALLASADQLYLAGGEGVLQGLALFDLEWPNIRAGQVWACGHAQEDDSAARLCSRYPDAGVYVLNLRQHPREWIAWLEAALAAARKLKDRQSEGVHLGNLGNAYFVLSEPRRAIEFYEEHLAISRKIGDRRGEGTDLGNLGNAYAALGETRRAIEHHEQALAISREIGDRRGEGNALSNLGNAYADLGEPRRAIKFHEQALAISREIGDKRAEGRDLGNLGIAYKDLGEPRRAIEYYKQALEIAREIGDRRGEGADLGNLGNAYFVLDDARRAIECYEQTLVIHREIGDRRGEGNALWNMALALDKLGERDQAIASAEAALEIREQIEDPNAAKVREQLAEWRGQK